eukprot:TRINITY_DN2977_c0_g1_i3.p2 TRINITY_DN2977_c0_g1~~TRINITY_DN2977_c0_g1_i3.p2  ORF type:complete len:100 (-),score=19.32 TRINITY_DN2977_c0_g1_i3:109-408(-)
MSDENSQRLPGELFYTGIFAYLGSIAYKVADKLRKGDVRSVTSQFSGFEVAMATMSILVFVLLVVLGWYEYSQRKAAMEHEEERQPLVRSSDSSASGAA